MLWTTIGIISGLTIQLLTLVSALQGRWERARWMALTLLAWGINAGFGAFIFHTAQVGDYWYWKPTLGTSAIIFTALVGAVLYFRRQTADETPTEEMTGLQTVALMLAALAFPLGWVAIGTVWM